MNIGDRFRDLIEALGLSQKALAEEYGCSPQNINNILKGQAVSHDLQVFLAHHYSVNLNWLLTGRGPMFLTERQAAAIAEAPATYEVMSDTQLLLELARRLGARPVNGPKGEPGAAEGPEDGE